MRLERYHRMLSQLAETGKVFACNCSRADIQRGSSDGQYPGYCRDKGLPLDTPDAAWRLRTEKDDVAAWNDGILGMQRVELFNRVRDFIVRRRDGLPAYQLASVCDDEEYGINLIVRGMDLIDSTAAQLRLAAVLGLETFRSCRFYHHPLLQDESGEKLSKSAGSQSLKAMRAEGILAADLRRMAADWYRRFLPAADLIL
jgi:glutamyl-tRNA synthetase